MLCSSAANPTFSAEELRHQLETTKPKLLFVHPTVLQTGLAVANAVGLSNDRVVLIQPVSNAKQPFVTLDEVIQEGLQQPGRFVERQLKPGEGKTKIAVSATPSPVHCSVKMIEWPVVLQLIVWDDGETQGIPACIISSSLELMDSIVCCDSSLLDNCECPTNGGYEQGVRSYRAAGEEEVYSGERFGQW